MDSGADECVFPASNTDLSLPPTTELVAANGSAIKTFGKRQMAISFAPGHRTFHTFWIATVKRPILGADFFFDNEMVIDICNRRLFFFIGVPQRLDAGDLGRPTRCCYLESIYHTWDGGTDHRASLVSHPTQCVAVLGGLH